MSRPPAEWRPERSAQFPALAFFCVYQFAQEVFVPADLTKYATIQVCAPKAEIRKIKRYARLKKVSVNGLVRKLLALVIDANTVI